MAKEWWELDNEELAGNPDAQTEMQLAFYNTFYATEPGRQVLLGLQRMCYGANDPIASVALIALFNQVRANCGVNAFVEMQAIRAEAKYINLDQKENDDANHDE